MGIHTRHQRILNNRKSMTKEEMHKELNDIVNRLSALHSEFRLHYTDRNDDDSVEAHNSISSSLTFAIIAGVHLKKLIDKQTKS